MKIFIDTNILISAILCPNSKPDYAVLLIKNSPNIGMICEQSITELYETFIKKFPRHMSYMEKFLSALLRTIEVVPIPLEHYEAEKNIREIKDRPLLRAAIRFGADFFLTGDKDFLESGIQNPKMINASDFLELELNKNSKEEKIL